MIRTLLSKLAYTVVSLFVLATATFFLMKSIPGDPFQSEKAIPPAVRANLEAKYGLDKPIMEQYVVYMKNLLQGDLGMSMKRQYWTVERVIGDSFAYSAKLGVFALLFSVTAGVGLGLLAALKHRKALDHITILIAVLGISVPSFVMATLLQYLFAVKIPLFNVAGLKEPGDYVLPVLALSFMPLAYIARLTRSTTLEALSSDYIRTARSKGLSGRAIMVKHALRNSILPVVTYVGPLTASIITGSVVVERIFGIPGLGKYFVSSVSNRDYTLIMGIALFYGFLLMVARLITDFAYILVDPRIKLSGGKEGA
jgi:oligopeptide transport system permease protein